MSAFRDGFQMEISAFAQSGFSQSISFAVRGSGHGSLYRDLYRC